MTAHAKYPASLLLAALAGFAAPGFAAEIVEVRTVTIVPDYHYAPPTTYYYSSTPTDYYYTPPLTEYYYAPPVVEYYYPPVTVTAPRATEDQLITSDVIDVLANDPRLSGRIDVETERNSVRLRGMVPTPGKARIAALDAQSVEGVREVRNELRTKVGGAP